MAKFEEQIKSLEEIVDKLEKGDLPLEESINLFEKGIALSNACREQVEAAEGKVQILLKQRNGEVKAEPFEKSKAESFEKS
jgi:exodeoxyribonuclease VII small subunit